MLFFIIITKKTFKPINKHLKQKYKTIALFLGPVSEYRLNANGLPMGEYILVVNKKYMKKIIKI